METQTSLSPKPRSEVQRPELIRLVSLSGWRKLIRLFVRLLSKVLVWIWLKPRVEGLENIPTTGPGIIVSNHLGDADLILGFAYSPVSVYPISKIELFDIPVLGRILDAYGVIWVHRGQPDRKALKVIFQALSEKQVIAIAPEGRESLTGSLEEGTGGAAYIALKAGVPLIPATFTGTENRRVFGNMKHFKRTETSLTIGEPFKLETTINHKVAIQRGTEKIMRTLAAQLPSDYRGVYRNLKDR